MSVMEKRRLGRGLDALLGGVAPRENEAVVTQLPVDQIENNPNQPRKDFDSEELAALKESLKTHGLLQPVVVRSNGDSYQLIAGERRLRAARDVGWKEIPVRVVDFNDQQVFEAAMVENLQRADLNPIEKAHGFQEYLNQYKVTQEELAKRMGLDRSTVTNFIRLLELPPTVQEAVRLGQISNGHARALLAIEDPQRQKQLCEEIIAKGLSVRAVEGMVKTEPADGGQRTPKPAHEKTTHLQDIENELRQLLATKVEVRLRGQDKGQFVIDFETNDDFERIVQHFRR